MNIKQFMLKIDECISKMDTEELRNSIHEIARIYDEKERENFLNVINRCKDKKSKISKREKEDDKKISGKIKEIILRKRDFLNELCNFPVTCVAALFIESVF